ncbi:MAG: hypothetical protein DHS20C18_02010 [Saprospiraceae bacterium]|nr:MAG: hypothetical protein DHS20C18_02010 [Saprospiraceae bacterium]
MRFRATILSLLFFLSISANLHAQFPCIGGTTISTSAASDTVDLCQDFGSSTVSFGVSLGALPFGYFVINETGTIVYIDTENDIDFSLLDGEVFQVYAFNYTGSIIAQVGDPYPGTQLASACSAITANFITVSGDALDGGTVRTEGGETMAFTCPTDSLADIVHFDSMDVSPDAAYTYIVTDSNNIILSIPSGDAVNFDTAAIGTCRVWGLAYSGNLTAMVGDNIMSTALSDNCFSLSDNFVSIIKQEPEGGTVSTEDGETEIDICIGDGISGIIAFDSMGVSGNFTYVVTDTNNVILSIPDGDIIDFENAGPGICRVWGLAYTGNITAVAGDTASSAMLTDGCYGLSDNFVTVNREETNGGTVSTSDGQTELFICLGDSVTDSISFDSMGAIGNFTFIVTDTNNVILAIPDSNIVDFGNANVGICRLWGLGYTGDLLAMVGDTVTAAALSDGCYALSQNFVTVNRGILEGGTVSTEDGATEVFTCPGDGNADIIRFDSSGVSAESFTYLITDSSNVILAIPTADMADFDDAGFGVCHVWGLAYSGNLTAAVGDTISTASLSDGCFDLSDNFITVNREQPEGGMVQTESGQTEVFTCPGDGNADLVIFDRIGASISEYAFIITDTNNVILALPELEMYDFDSSGVGVCRVWGVAYTGNLTAMVGDDITVVNPSDACFDLSDNFISVFREQPIGGTVSTEAGETELFICVGDGTPDTIRFDSMGVTGNFTYVVTDTNNVILSLPTSDVVDFDAAGTGICRLWGLAYTGNLTAAVGDTASLVDLSDDCFVLSDNFVTVNRDEVSGGMVMTEDGATEVFACIGDGNPDIVHFDSSDVSGPNFTYVVTDTNNVILSFPEADSLDFEPAGIGVCRVWGLAYSDSLLAMVGDTASLADLALGCFDLSNNYITVTRGVIDGGAVITEDSMTVAYTCPGDSLADIIYFDSIGVVGPNFIYVVTDTNNVILNVSSVDSIDFEGAGVGICRVWGLSYTGNLTAMIGDTADLITLSDGCFDLSNDFVTVYREVPEGGTVSTESGSTQLSFCVGDGIADIVRFDSAGVGNSLFTYVVTNANNIILSIPGSDMVDFENAGGGTCRVWGLAYTGNLTATVGDNAGTATLTDACFDLSENFITVIRIAVSGGSVSTEDDETVVYTCPGDSIADVIYFDSLGAVGDSFTYVITDNNNVILNITTADSVDFEGAGIGICRVWGLGYLGNLTAMVGDTASAIALSDSCYALSGNFITINRDEPDGGMVTTQSGDTISTVCFTNGGQNTLQFDSIGVSNSRYTYVVTDSNNVIVKIPDTDLIDFDGTGEADSWVWGFAYTGNITAMVGDTLTLVDLSDECYDLSDNFVIVSKEQVDGGMVMTEDGESVVYTCPGDGEADIVRFDTTGFFGDSFTYLITDTNFVILSVPDSDMQDFEGAGEGVCLVWGLGYTGTLTAMVGDTASLIDLTDQCFDLSSTYITVYREVPEGGMVMTASGAISVSVTVGDSIPDLIFFDSTGVSNSLYTYVITDENNAILSVPDGDAADFELAGAGICHVWGLAYTGTLSAIIGEVIDSIALSDACFDLSDNFITVERTLAAPQPAPGLPDVANYLPEVVISAWPNPVSDVLHLQIITPEPIDLQDNQSASTGLLQILDINGQVVLSRQVVPNSEIDLDITHLVAGSYWLRYRSPGNVQSLNFVKQ